MSKHICMLNPVESDVLVHNTVCDFACPDACNVVPCDCAGPGGIVPFIEPSDDWC